MKKCWSISRNVKFYSQKRLSLESEKRLLTTKPAKKLLSKFCCFFIALLKLFKEVLPVRMRSFAIRMFHGRINLKF
jgi:hypothetical protein